MTIFVAAALTGAAAWALSGWVRALARPSSTRGGLGQRLVRTGVLAPLGGILGGSVAALARDWFELLAFCALALACTLLVVIDLATHRLPDVIVGPACLALFAVLTVTAATTGSWAALARAALAAAVVTVGYFLLALASPAGLGLGDVKLAGLLGAFLGWQGWPQVAFGTLAAFVLNGVFVTVLLLAGKINRRSAVAFGPWLVLGAAMAAAWGAAA